MLLYVLLKRLSTCALHDIARKSDAVVGVSRNLAGREDSHRLVADQVVAYRHGLFRVGEDDVVDRFLKPSGMRHQVAQRYGLIECGTNLKIEIVVYVRVEIQPALLNQLHYGDPRKEL